MNNFEAKMKDWTTTFRNSDSEILRTHTINDIAVPPVVIHLFDDSFIHIFIQYFHTIF